MKVLCTGEFCTWRSAGAETQSSENAGSALIDRNTDCALNILHVTGLLTSGDGCAKASRLLGLIGPPSLTTVCSSSSHNIEQTSSPEFVSTANDIVCTNILQEDGSAVNVR